jgi:alkaline phosphatase D
VVPESSGGRARYPLSRRRFVGAAGRAVAGLALGPVLVSGDSVRARSRPGGAAPVPADVFRLGVASGDPSPDGVVLWTRLAPAPTDGGGMPDRTVEVDWEVADDERFTAIRQRGTAVAEPRLGHSVHVELAGLDPDRWYHYRFRVGADVSPVGRTRTAAAPGQRLERLRFAFASCQDYQAGFYTAYQHLIAEDIAFVAFLGDYIYESAAARGAIRQHDGTGEPRSLGEYRNRHAHYRGDPDLRALHAAVPWIVTLDDHEIDSNWADEVPDDPRRQSAETFRARRRAALQAYYEHMPLRRSSLPRGLDMRLYRRLGFGQLATVHVLDTRQYRTDQAADLAGANDPARSMTGADQERWLIQGMSGSGTRWNLVANQTQMASNDETPGPARSYDFDNWDGYRAQRRRLLEFFGSGRSANTVVLTGDRHATWVSDLRPDFDDPTSPVVAAELVGTSVSSEGDTDQAKFHATFDPILADSPHWKYIDKRRGYFVCEVTPQHLTASLRVVDTVRATTARVTTAARFQVTAGVPGVSVLDQDDPLRPG